MTDYATPQGTSLTPPAPTGFGLITPQWFQKVGVDFITEMKAKDTPHTPVEGSGTGGGRPSVGLVFPH